MRYIVLFCLAAIVFLLGLATGRKMTAERGEKPATTDYGSAVATIPNTSKVGQVLRANESGTYIWVDQVSGYIMTREDADKHCKWPGYMAVMKDDLETVVCLAPGDPVTLYR